MTGEDNKKAFEFKYIIKQLSDSPFTKAIIANDIEEAKELYAEWKKTVGFEIKDIDNQQITD